MFDPTEQLPLQQTQIKFGLFEIVLHGQSFHRLKIISIDWIFFSYGYFRFLLLPAQIFRAPSNDFFINIVISDQMQRFRSFNCKARKRFFSCVKMNKIIFSLY